MQAHLPPALVSFTGLIKNDEVVMNGSFYFPNQIKKLIKSKMTIDYF